MGPDPPSTKPPLSFPFLPVAPSLHPTWVQRLDLVVGQVEDAQVSQGLQVLHPADAVAGQGEEPAEHGGVRGGPHCSSRPPAQEGAPLSPQGQELPIPQVGETAQILNLLNLVLEREKGVTCFSEFGSILGLPQAVMSPHCHGSFTERVQGCDNTGDLAESRGTPRLLV